MRVCFITHGSKKSALEIAAALSSLKPQHYSFEFLYTLHRRHAENLAKLNAEKCDILVSIGGDGTLHECLNGVMQWLVEHPESQLPLIAPVAVGSGNDFVRNFKLDHTPESIVERLQKLSVSWSDVGSLRYSNGNQEFFINEASIGLGPAVVRFADSLPSFLSGNLKFGLSILKTIITYQKKNVQVNAVNFRWSGKAMAIVVANGKYFGSGICIAPDASVSDGLFDLIIVGNVSTIDYLRYLPDLKRGKKIQHPELHYYRTNQVTIETDGLVELDGESGVNSKGIYSITGMKIGII